MHISQSREAVAGRLESLQRQNGPSDGTVGISGKRKLPGKPIPPKLYRIGELVDYACLSRQTIHNYTAMGLLRESRWTRGGHRLYDESVFGRLDQIARLKGGSKSMQEIREFFSRIDGCQ